MRSGGSFQQGRRDELGFVRLGVFGSTARSIRLTGCTRLDAIPAAPLQTAATWLTIQPYATVKIASQEIIPVQPSTKFFVSPLRVLDHVSVARKGYFSFREAGLIP